MSDVETISLESMQIVKSDEGQESTRCFSAEGNQLFLNEDGTITALVFNEHVMKRGISIVEISTDSMSVTEL